MRLLCLDLLLISVIFSDFNRQQKGKISDKDKNRSGRRWGYNLFLFSAALDLAPPPTWRLQGHSVRDSSLPLPALGWARTKAWKQGVLQRAAGVQDLQGGGDTDRSECECSALSAHTGAGKALKSRDGQKTKPEGLEVHTLALEGNLLSGKFHSS